MNSKPTIIFFIGCFLAIAIYIISSVLVSSGSNIAALAKYIAIASFFIGFIYKKPAFYIMVVYAATSDLLKRTLVVEGAFTEMDISYILMICPLMMFGLFLGVVSERIFKRKFDKLSRNAFLIGTFLGLYNFVSSINFEGGVLGALQVGANVVSYFYLPFCALLVFKDQQDYLKLLKFATLVFIPVALYALSQTAIGYSNFEIDYLFSGFTSVADLNNINDTRPYSTVSSPGACAYSCGVFGVLCLLLSDAKNRINLRGSVMSWRPALLSLLLFVVLFIGMMATKSRTQILIVLFIIPFFYLFSSYKKTVFAYFSVFCFVGLLFLSSGYILDNNLINDYQMNIVPQLSRVTGLDDRYFTLSTMNIRLEGWNAVLTNPEFWKPFGNRDLIKEASSLSMMEARNAGIRTHDAFSLALLKLGYVPVFIVIATAVPILLKLHRYAVIFPSKSYESRAFRIGLLVLYAGYFGTLAGGAMSAFPVALVMNLGVALCYMASRSRFREQANLENSSAIQTA